ncbi:MAG: helix-turn-helix transcriptional regulator [Ruminococcaceae bacterium]|nr:helix-turn-helix transcriptional regulator [Oscillospiraceae bacterium]
MNINIGTTIKNLRTKKQITQKQLATYLGVTEQAVSRWESGGGFPDIQLLPSIASFFSISTDTLLGINVSEREQRLAEIRNKIDEACELGRESTEDTIAEARAWAAEFPGEEDIQRNLADEICKYTMWDEKPKMGLLREAEKIYCTLIDTTGNTEFRNHVIEVLTALYCIGFRDTLRADTCADQISSMKYCRESVKSSVFSAWVQDHPEDEHLLVHYQDYLEKLLTSFCNQADTYVIAHIPNTPDRFDEKIAYFDWLIETYKMFFGENMLTYHADVANWYRIGATYTVAQGKIKETLDRLEKMAEHSLKADMARPGDAYTSPFTNKMTYPGKCDDFDTLSVHNFSYYNRQKLDQSRYDPIREEPRFKNICAILEENMK